MAQIRRERYKGERVPEEKREERKKELSWSAITRMRCEFVFI